MENKSEIHLTKLQISPQTRIGDFLVSYPELEDLLINLSPAFQKLKNPVLRKTIGRVATIQQIAVVGNIPLETIINALRKAAGQNPTQEIMNNNIQINEKPSWFNTKSIVATLDAREMLEVGQHPLAEVLAKTSALQRGQIYELITPFTPLPLIEKVTATGCAAYQLVVGETEIHTYFCKL